MTEVTSSEIRNSNKSLLNRVAAGEEITITVNGPPVAVLQPVGKGPRSLEQAEFLQHTAPRQADSDLQKELLELASGFIDDLPAIRAGLADTVRNHQPGPR